MSKKISGLPPYMGPLPLPSGTLMEISLPDLSSNTGFKSYSAPVPEAGGAAGGPLPFRITLEGTAITSDWYDSFIIKIPYSALAEWSIVDGGGGGLHANLLYLNFNMAFTIITENEDTSLDERAHCSMKADVFYNDNMKADVFYNDNDGGMEVGVVLHNYYREHLDDNSDPLPTFPEDYRYMVPNSSLDNISDHTYLIYPSSVVGDEYEGELSITLSYTHPASFQLNNIRRVDYRGFVDVVGNFIKYANQ